MKYLLDRFSERSTWLGLAALAGSLGVVIEPALVEHIAGIGVGVVGLVFALTADRDRTK